MDKGFEPCCSKEEKMIILQNPKYVENLAGVIRAAACFDFGPIVWTGDRIERSEYKMKKLSAGHALNGKQRMMREFRHPDYKHVLYARDDRPFDLLVGNDRHVVPVCVEVDGSEELAYFEHPLHAAYIFGPEDGSVSQMFKILCQRFVRIPSKYCLNLAASVNIVLADRTMKLQRLEIRP